MSHPILRFAKLVSISMFAVAQAPVVDDVLGVTSTKEKLGKSVNIDDANNKVTFASLLGVEGATKLAKEEVEKAKNFLGPYSAKAEVLLALSDYITRRSF